MFLPHITTALKMPGPARGPVPVWVTRRGVTPGIAGVERMRPTSGYYLVHAWFGDTYLFEQIEAMFRSIGGESVSHPVTAGDRTDPIIRAFEDERLWLWRMPIPGVPWPTPFPERPKSAPPPASPTEVLTWIEVSLVDEAGDAVVDEPVRVVDVDGTAYERRTDTTGLLRIERLPAGPCEVSFPRIDGREWSREGEPFADGAGAIEKVHLARADECMGRIAFAHKFRSPMTLYTHPCNAELRGLRPNSDLLWPGDRVNILVREVRVDHAATTTRHRYRVKTAVRWLRVVLHGFDRQSLANTDYLFHVDGRGPVARATDERGLLEEIVPP